MAFVVVFNRDRIECKALGKTVFQQDKGKFLDFRERRIDFQNALGELPVGWYGHDLLKATPHFNKNFFMLPDENEGALSESINCGIPHKLKSFSRQLITAEEYMLGHRKANGNLEYY